MEKFWYSKDVSLKPLKKKPIAIIGYGNQGRAQSNNLRKSGLKVIVGLRKGSNNWKKAVSDGHIVKTIEEAVKLAEIIHILVPDIMHAELYEKRIRPNLTKGKTLSFSHGASIYWKWINPPEDMDVILVVPQTLSKGLEEKYDQENIVFAISTHKNSQKALEKALALAKGMGGNGSIMTKISFKDEVIVNWFAEQTDLVGGLAAMMMKCYKVLVEAGFPPMYSYLQVLHQVDESANLIKHYGIKGMYEKLSDTAQYGGLTRGPRTTTHVEKDLKKILEEIVNGVFEAELTKPHDKKLKVLMKEMKNDKIENIGIRMREIIYGKDKK